MNMINILKIQCSFYVHVSVYVENTAMASSIKNDLFDRVCVCVCVYMLESLLNQCPPQSVEVKRIKNWLYLHIYVCVCVCVCVCMWGTISMGLLFS